MLIKPDSRLLSARGFDLGGMNCKRLAFGSIELGGKVPTEIHLMPIGKWEGYIHPNPDIGQMTVEVTPERVNAAVAYHTLRKQRAPKRDLVIDYDHQSLKGGQAPAAGWCGKLEARDNGLWGTDLKWTATAKKFIEEGEYRYISPVWLFDVIDKVSAKMFSMAVFQAAITNEPFFDELEPLVATDNSQQLYFFKGDSIMDELLERLKYFLNLPLTATAEIVASELEKLIGQVKDAIAAQTNQAANLPAVLQFLKDQKQKLASAAANYSLVVKTLGLTENAGVEEVKAVLLTATGNQSQIPAMLTKIKDLEQKELDREFARVIDSAFQAGKILPVQKNDAEWLTAQKDFATRNFTGFEQFWSKQPVVGPVQKLPIEGSPASAGAGLTETDIQIGKNLGVSEDALKKHVKAAV